MDDTMMDALVEHYGMEYLEAIGEDDVEPMPMEEIESFFDDGKQMFDLIDHTGYDVMGHGEPFDMDADFFVLDVDGNIGSLKRDDLAEYLRNWTALGENEDDFLDWCKEEGHL